MSLLEYECDPVTKAKLQERIELRCKTNSNGCWLWQGKLTVGDTGTVRIDGLHFRVDKVSYWVYVGPVPKFHKAVPQCGNSRCCNPSHLQLIAESKKARLIRKNNLTDAERLAIRNSKATIAQLMIEYDLSRDHVKSIRNA